MVSPSLELESNQLPSLLPGTLCLVEIIVEKPLRRNCLAYVKSAFDKRPHRKWSDSRLHFADLRESKNTCQRCCRGGSVAR